MSDDKAINKKVGQMIAKVRKGKGISQTGLANEVKLSQAVISSYELGTRRIPLPHFIKIARTLGVSAGKLLDEEVLQKGPTSLRFSRRLPDMDKLPEFEKRLLVRIIDALVFKMKAGE